MIHINGNWNDGYAFDYHILSSTFIGNNEYGHPEFDTIRTPIGQCLYKLKYQQSQESIDKIVNIIKEDKYFNDFIKQVNTIIPVPPSNNYRILQPVLLISREIAKIYGKTIKEDVLESTNKEQIKNVPTEEKYEKIRNTIKLSSDLNKTDKLLIIDDVFDSGSTLTAIVSIIKEHGYKNINIFTLTKTKKAD